MSEEYRARHATSKSVESPERTAKSAAHITEMLSRRMAKVDARTDRLSGKKQVSTPEGKVITLSDTVNNYRADSGARSLQNLSTTSEQYRSDEAGNNNERTYSKASLSSRKVNGETSWVGALHDNRTDKRGRSSGGNVMAQADAHEQEMSNQAIELNGSFPEVVEPQEDPRTTIAKAALQMRRDIDEAAAAVEAQRVKGK